MSPRRERPELRIGMVGAGTMARAHSAALSLIGPLYADLPVRIRLVAVADINGTVAADLADRYGYERVAYASASSGNRTAVELPAGL